MVAVPFVSITEQNADVYRRLLDEPGEPPWSWSTTADVDLDGGRTRGPGGTGSRRRTGTPRSW